MSAASLRGEMCRTRLPLMMLLTLQAALGLAFLVVVQSVLLFAAAGTFAYWQAWTFLAVFTCAVAGITIDLIRHDPALLESRVRVGPLAEPKRRQQVIQTLASLAFLALFVIGGLDRRLGWSNLPTPLVLVGDVLVAGGLLVVFRVFRANPFTSATIEVARGQHVVSTGPYAIVRHPMYTGGLIMILGVPIALGSWCAAIAVPVLIAVIVWRLLDEEKQLAADLPGYAEYQINVRSRLVPLVW